MHITAYYNTVDVKQEPPKYNICVKKEPPKIADDVNTTSSYTTNANHSFT